MKKLILFLILTMITNISVLSQECLPEGIEFTTQAQIDSFQINYPNCTKIEGKVTIGGEDIANLNGLSVLTSIGNSLYINGGFSQGNPLLTTLSGLNNLTSVGKDIIILSNKSLSSLSGLSNLDSIGFNNNINISGNDSLINLEGLEFLTKAGNIKLIGNINLNSLEGLNNLDSIFEDLEIKNNYKLVSLTGLQNLESIFGTFLISNNNSLVDLSGLHNLFNVSGKLWIDDNDSLKNLEGLSQLVSINRLIVYSLDNLKGLDNLCTINHLHLQGQFINFEGMPKVKKIGALSIDVHNVSDLEGLELIESIDTLGIGFCSNLITLKGLDNLRYLNYLGMQYNDKLENIQAIENIDPDSISGIFMWYNKSLSECAIKSICEFIRNNINNVSITGNGTRCSDLYYLVNDCIESTDELSNHYDVKIYPNPATNKIFITTNDSYPINKIIMYNNVGMKVMYHTSVENEFDINNIDSGLYVIELILDKKTIRKRIIVK